MDSITIDGVQIFLSRPTALDMEWIGQSDLMEQLLAAWATIHEADVPMCPRILGQPGSGKTTLAYAAAKKINKQVFIFQCTADTRPEDLIITPVLGSKQDIRYHASALVTAMITGAVCILDEGNRMPEKSWASLAPLLDRRRYVESILAGVQIKAHPDFRVCVTMNQDASVFEIPDYIGSRLQPKIHVNFPSRQNEIAILQYNIPFAQKEVIDYVVDFLQKAHKVDEPYSVRDGVNIARYMLKMAASEPAPFDQPRLDKYFKMAVAQVLDPDALDVVNGSKRKLRTGFPGISGQATTRLADILKDFDFSSPGNVDFDDENDTGEDPDDDEDLTGENGPIDRATRRGKARR
ncbi:MAG: AAA domain-containing protein [Candidatus Lokiarchaeota archaeon]|nr:AAA domain-containing protein [Candidatus Lokiarchaeota archaeon]